MSKVTFDITPLYRELLAAHGLDSFEALFDCRSGRYVDGHRDRSVVRLALADAAGRQTVFYLKREWNPKLAMLLRRLLANPFRPPPSRAMHELKNLTLLRQRDIDAAEPVAVGEVRSGGFFSRALLLVREVSDAVNLGDYLQSFPARPGPAERAAKRELARQLGAYIRRMHDSGMAYRDLYAKHIFISPERPGGSFRPTLIDAQRAHRFPNLTPQFRWRDLAALLVTTRYPACTAADRLRFILAYSRQSKVSDGLKLMIRQTVARAARMRGRGLDPQLDDSRRRAPPGQVPRAAENLVHLDDNRLLATERFLPALRQLGLDSFAAVMNYGGGETYRDVPDRLTVRISPCGTAGLVPPCDGVKTTARGPAVPPAAPSAIYLKRHQQVDATAWLEGLFFWRKPDTRAGAEYSNIMQLASEGFAVPTLVALGEERRWSRRQKSFLMTEELPAAVPADDYLRSHFAASASGANTETGVAAKRRLVREIARLARRFHGAGFYHRDFYLCHIFVREMPAGMAADEPLSLPGRGRAAGPGEGVVLQPLSLDGRGWSRQSRDEGAAPQIVAANAAATAPGAFVLYLIDLQRVRRCEPGRVGRRWLVKDLAALNYSAPAGLLTRTDRVRFLREYLGLTKLDAAARALAAAVLAKTRRIARHDAKLQGRKA